MRETHEHPDLPQRNSQSKKKKKKPTNSSSFITFTNFTHTVYTLLRFPQHRSAASFLCYITSLFKATPLSSLLILYIPFLNNNSYQKSLHIDTYIYIYIYICFSSCCCTKRVIKKKKKTNVYESCGFLYYDQLLYISFTVSFERSNG